MPQNLFALAKSEGILVDYYDFPCNILGAYYHVEKKPPVILLDKKIRNNHRLLRCIFAEELGHHFTSTTDRVAFARSDKNYIMKKNEKSAIFWAVKYLMPMDELIKAVNSGLFYTHLLAEYFYVTERFVGTGIRLYLEEQAKRHGTAIIEVP
ncbi:MAG: ImmA/IrrE family metallo-endopeptidase [Syntrophomonadaceae bacterium]|jgi:Zn-dependent peptidase ImmA (M78 family)